MERVNGGKCPGQWGAWPVRCQLTRGCWAALLCPPGGKRSASEGESLRGIALNHSDSWVAKRRHWPSLRCFTLCHMAAREQKAVALPPDGLRGPDAGGGAGAGDMGWGLWSREGRPGTVTGKWSMDLGSCGSSRGAVSGRNVLGLDDRSPKSQPGSAARPAV